jgi:hypothetical protein
MRDNIQPSEALFIIKLAGTNQTTGFKALAISPGTLKVVLHRLTLTPFDQLHVSSFKNYKQLKIGELIVVISTGAKPLPGSSFVLSSAGSIGYVTNKNIIDFTVTI